MVIDAVINQVGENASRFGEQLDKAGRRLDWLFLKTCNYGHP